MKAFLCLTFGLISFNFFSQTTIVAYKYERTISEKNFKELPEFAKKAFLKDYFYTLISCNNVSEYKMNDSINTMSNSEMKEKNDIEKDNSMQKHIYKEIKNNLTLGIGV